jgi:predicted exporter
MANREHVHELVDRLPDSDVPAVEKLLESLTESPAERAIRLAPPDDEPVTAADARAIAEAESDSRPPVPLEDLLAEYRVK